MDQHPLELKYLGPEEKENLRDYLKSSAATPEDSYFIYTVSRLEKFFLILSREDLTVTGWVRGVIK